MDSANTVPTETFAQKYRPVIATAAVLLIGIGITPMGIQTPQTESDDVAANQDTESSQILSKSQSHSAPKVNSNESEFTQAQAVPNGMVSSASESDIRSQTSPENYRSSPLLWVIEIKRLYHEKNTDKALEELIAFRKAYPNNSNERLLPEELKNIRLD